MEHIKSLIFVANLEFVAFSDSKFSKEITTNNTHIGELTVCSLNGNQFIR